MTGGDAGTPGTEKVDVVVIGAGPAGSTAAWKAAEGGADVLLLEKRPIIGVPVRCGEFLPSKGEVASFFPDALNLESLLDLPQDLVQRKIDKIRVYSPKLRPYELPFDGSTTDRDRFDQYLALRAEKAGARVEKGARVTSIRNNEVMLGDRHIQTKIIVGADGPLSLVARSLGLERSWDLCPAMAAFSPGDFEPVAEMYFGSVSPGGYAWVIPKKGGANVGLGVSRLFTKTHLIDHYRSFIAFRHLDPGPASGKMVPMSGPISKTVSGNALVVGDAAGQVMPVNGGGIPIAIICGAIAGEVSAGAAKGKRSLNDYESEWRRQVGKPLATALRTKRLAMLAFGSPWRLEQAMRMLGIRRMGKAIRCKSVFP
ncbi:MAG: NAD(P)/FAD-dependent oxidoreductase [Methanomassiliicoccales archaeon]|nr:NAD(P)/FAD-dependent oxidoreductase [Methanomassiliicoccales archaeon]